MSDNTVCVICRAAVYDRASVRLERDCCGRGRSRRCLAAAGARRRRGRCAHALTEFPPPRRRHAIGQSRRRWPRPTAGLPSRQAIVPWLRLARPPPPQPPPYHSDDDDDSHCLHSAPHVLLTHTHTHVVHNISSFLFIYFFLLFFFFFCVPFPFPFCRLFRRKLILLYT